MGGEEQFLITIHGRGHFNITKHENSGLNHVDIFISDQFEDLGPQSRLSTKPTFKVFCKVGGGVHCLTIRDGMVTLAQSDPSDPYQLWHKDEKFSTRVMDEVGRPSFALVNNATGQAIKHSLGERRPLQLIPYDPDALDESILWSSEDSGDGFRAIRMVNNISLNFDAWQGVERLGGVYDGIPIVLHEWNHGDNQQWKIIPS